MEYAYHGLLLTAPQMAKFGQLYLQNGLAATDLQLVARDWTEQSTTEKIQGQVLDPFNPGQVILKAGYGYLFWIYNDTSLGNYYCAIGAYGQDICVHPELQRVSVQQRDGDADPFGNLVTTAVAFDETISFLASDGTKKFGRASASITFVAVTMAINAALNFPYL